MKNGEQYILVKKPYEEPKSIIKKLDERKEEIKKSDPIQIIKPLVIKPLVKTESVNNLKIIEEIVEIDTKEEAVDINNSNDNSDTNDTNNEESTSSNESLSYSETLLEKFRRSVQKVKDQTKGPKGNAFEKFKEAYMTGATAPNKPVEKSKYLQLY